MIAIAICFLLIGWIEQSYMSRHKRKLQTRIKAASVTLIMLLFIETIYLTQNVITTADIFMMLFQNFQRLLEFGA